MRCLVCRIRYIQSFRDNRTVKDLGADIPINDRGHRFQFSLGHELIFCRIGTGGVVPVHREDHHGIPKVRDHITVAFFAEGQQKSGTVRGSIVPLLIEAQIGAAGIVSGEIVFPSKEDSEPYIAFHTLHRYLDIHIEIIGRIEHTGKAGHFRTAVSCYQGTDPGLL